MAPVHSCYFINGITEKLKYSYITVGQSVIRQTEFVQFAENKKKCLHLVITGPLSFLGSECYYGWDLYHTWVQMLLEIGPLLYLGPIITVVPSTPSLEFK